MPLSLSHNLAARASQLDPGARLHYARGEVISVRPYRGQTDVTLAPGDQLLFCAKARNVRDDNRLVLVTLTEADWDASAGAYVQEFSGRTAPIAALLGITGSGSSNDVPSTIIDCNLVFIPSGETEQVGDTFQLTLECPTYDPDDALPDAAADSGILSARYENGQFILTTVEDGEVAIGQSVGGSGSSFSSGAGAPSGGSNGDVYLDTDTLYFYAKAAGVWTALFQGVPIN